MILTLLFFLALDTCDTLYPEKKISYGPIAEMVPVFSPDGEWILFEYFHDDGKNFPQIWIMPRNGLFNFAKPLVDDGNSNAEYTWSSDGEWVAYIKYVFNEEDINIVYSQGLDRRQIYVINIKTGEERRLSAFKSGHHFGDRLAWIPDSDIIAFEKNLNIYGIDKNSGNQELLVNIDNTGTELSKILWLSIAPDASTFLFEGYVNNNPDKSNIWMIKNEPVAVPVQLTFYGYDALPAWHSGSKKIVFTREVSHNMAHLFILKLEEDDFQPNQITCGNNVDFSANWDPGGKFILFSRNDNFRQDVQGSIWEGFHIWELDLGFTKD